MSVSAGLYGCYDKDYSSHSRHDNATTAGTHPWAEGKASLGFPLIFHNCFGKTQPSMSMLEWVKCSPTSRNITPSIGTRGRLGELENEETEP